MRAVGRPLFAAAAAQPQGALAIQQVAEQRDSQYSSEGPGDLYRPKSAMEFIAQVPPKVVHGNQTRCDGGGGALGHPAIFINLNRGVGTCGYCGLRFQQDEHHGHH